MNKITDYTTRARSVLLEQLKKQYGSDSAVPSVFSSVVPVVTPISKIDDYTTRVVSPILEQLKKQYGGWPQLIVDFSYIIVGDIYYFTSIVSGAGGMDVTYDWDFDDGSAHDFTANPSHQFIGYGDFDVVLTIHTLHTTATVTKTISIAPLVEQLIWLKGDMNLLDSSGRGHDAEWLGGSPVYGINGFEIKYRPTYGYIRTPSHIDFSWDPLLSYEMRFDINISYVSLKYSELKMMKCSEYSGLNRDFQLTWQLNGTNDVTFNITTPEGRNQNYGVIGSVNTTYNVKLTYNAGRFELYLNNILKAPTSYDDFSLMDNSIFQYCFVCASYYGKAYLSNFEIYNGIL